MNLWVFARLLLAAALTLFGATASWEFFLALNVRLSPSVAWYHILVAGLLLVLWRLLHPGWIPRSFFATQRPKPAVFFEGIVGIVGCVCLIFVLAVLRPYIMAPVGRKILEHTALQPNFSLVAPAFAAVLEEFVFRGLLQSNLEEKFGVPTAIAVTSVLFLLLHVGNNEFASQWPFYLIFSIFVGVLSWRTGSMAFPVVIHLSVNLAGNVVVLFTGPLDPRRLNSWTVWALIITACSAIAIVAFLECRQRALPDTGIV